MRHGCLRLASGPLRENGSICAHPSASESAVMGSTARAEIGGPKVVMGSVECGPFAGLPILGGILNSQALPVMDLPALSTSTQRPVPYVREHNSEGQYRRFGARETASVSIRGAQNSDAPLDRLLAESSTMKAVMALMGAFHGTRRGRSLASAERRLERWRMCCTCED